MRVSEAVYQRLMNYAGTAEYLTEAGGGEVRIYPTVAKQTAAFPFVVFQLTGGEPVESMDGPSGLGFQRVLVKTFMNDEDYETLERLTEQVILALAGYDDFNIGWSSCNQQSEPRYDYDEEAKAHFSILEFVVGFEKPKLS